MKKIVLSFIFGMLILGIATGCDYSKKNETNTTNELYVKVYFVSKDELGRSTEIWDGYKGVYSINNGNDISATVSIIERQEFDGNIYYLLKLTSEQEVSYQLNDNISMTEGGKLIATGIIVDENAKLDANDNVLKKTCAPNETVMTIMISNDFLTTTPHYSLYESKMEKIVINGNTYYGSISFDEGIGLVNSQDTEEYTIYIHLCEEVDIKVNDTIKIVAQGETIIESKVHATLK